MANEFKIKNGLILDGISSGSSSTEVLVLNTSTNQIESKQIDTLSGISGESGLSGNVGISGISGTSGRSGISGQVGVSGTSGVSGQVGVSGSSGISGQVGTSGLSGISGRSGVSGQVGTSGISGLSGFSGESGLSGESGQSGIYGPALFTLTTTSPDIALTANSAEKISNGGTTTFATSLESYNYAFLTAKVLTSNTGNQGQFYLKSGSIEFGFYFINSNLYFKIDGSTGYVGGYSANDILTVIVTDIGVTLLQNGSVVQTGQYNSGQFSISLLLYGLNEGFSNISFGYVQPGISGISGQVGTSGFSGLSGQSGFSGISGLSGISGRSGLSGLQGVQGLSGESGTSGTSGESGTSGFFGISGFSGESGLSGFFGISGFSGESGISGQSGFSGLSGTSGFSGLSGQVGTSGFSGLSGTSGFSGLSGQVGTSGLSGRSGISGFQGTSGFSGNSGESGLSGVSGDIGVLSGSYGNPNGTLTGPYPNNILYYDSNGSVWQWNTSSWNQIGDISGISGYSGISGDSGISGELGVSGFSGVSGRSGISGLSGQVGTSGLSGQVGTSGFSGLSGQSGFSGLSGQVGTSGFSGLSGSSGFSGLSGQVGTSGLSGTSGFSGLSGQVGTSGLSGLSGRSGISGFQGVQGFSGESGTSGTSGESGISGESGTSGFFGISGFSGESGLSGFFGFSGFSGLSGESGISGISGQGFNTVQNPATTRILTSDGTTQGAIAQSGITYDGSGLYVSGTTTTNNNISVNHTTNDARIYLRNTTTGYGATDGLLCELVDVNAYIWNYENGPFYFGTNSTARMTILGDGNVGIGTTSPVFKLEVLGSFSTTTNGQSLQFANGILYHGNYYQVVSGNDYMLYARSGGKLLLGSNDTQRVQLGLDGSVGIGTSSATGRLHVKSTGTTNATYNTIFENGSNVQIGYMRDDGLFYTYLDRILMNETWVGKFGAGSNNLVLGKSAGGTLGYNGGNNNISIGFQAGIQLGASAEKNLLIGTNVGYSMTSGSANMFLGYQAGLYTSTGGENMAMGSEAFRQNETGTGNVAIGSLALYTGISHVYNTGIGYQTGYLNTGDYGVFIGFRAGYNNGSGSNNTYLGSLAAYNMSTGSNNTVIGYSGATTLNNGSTTLTNATNGVYIGYQTRGNANSETNAIVIGYQANGLGSNTVVLGNDSITTTALKGNVGIGTTTPSVKLDVRRGTNGEIAYFIGSGTTGVIYGTDTNLGYLTSSDSNSSLGFGINGGTSSIRIATNGSVGIGNASPTAKLHVSGGGSTSGSIALRIENSSANPSLVVRDDGNIGINTSAPGSLLTLNTSFATTNGLTISSDNSSDSQIIIRRAASKPVLGLLAFDTATYITNGVYFDGGNWIHHSDGNDNSVLSFDPGVGASWYASNNGSGSWNVSNNITLWDDSSNWKSLVQSTRTGDSYFSGGRLGINTTSPTDTLDVAGGMRFGSGTTTNAVIQRRQTPAGAYSTIIAAGTGISNAFGVSMADTWGAILDLRAGPPSTDQYGGGIILTANGSTGALGDGNAIVFKNRTGTNTYAERMRIAYDGNVSIDTDTLYVDAVNSRVGIGVSTLNYLFEVAQGDISFDSSRFFYDSSNKRFGLFAGSSPQANLHLDGTLRIDNQTAAAPGTTAISSAVTNYYGGASSSGADYLSEPAVWLKINLDGTDYYIPAYS